MIFLRLQSIFKFKAGVSLATVKIWSWQAGLDSNCQIGLSVQLSRQNSTVRNFHDNRISSVTIFNSTICIQTLRIQKSTPLTKKSDVKASRRLYTSHAFQSLFPNSSSLCMDRYRRRVLFGLNNLYSRRSKQQIFLVNSWERTFVIVIPYSTSAW